MRINDVDVQTLTPEEVAYMIAEGSPKLVSSQTGSLVARTVGLTFSSQFYGQQFLTWMYTMRVNHTHDNYHHYLLFLILFQYCLILYLLLK